MIINKVAIGLACAILCCVSTKTAKAERWIVVTGASSKRLAWAAFSLGNEHLNPNSSEALASPDLLIDTLSNNLAVPLVSNDAVSCDLPVAVQPISATMLSKDQTVELLHYLTRHLHNAAGNSDFELQVECPLQAIPSLGAYPTYVSTSLVLSLKDKTKTGFNRLVTLSNAIGSTVAQVRMRAFDEKDVISPRILPENTTHSDLVAYWNQHILAPLCVDCSSIVYDDNLDCLIIDVKKSKYESLGKLAQLYWAGEILK